MNDRAGIEKKEIICHCTCTTRAQVIALIQAGADSLEKIAYHTGASAGCGGCEDSIVALLTQHNENQANES